MISEQSNQSDLNLQQEVSFLLRSFRFERFFYLLVTLLSFIVLGYCVCVMLKNRELLNVLAMLGPTGFITLSCFRILKMWTDCLELYKMYLTNK
jgi:hypothetical protein